MSTEHLLTDTSDGGHGATQGDLAREAHGWGHDAAREKRDKGEDDGYTSRGAILLDRTRREMELTVSISFGCHVQTLT